MRVSTALNMLRDHGCKAFICAEGVVAVYERDCVVALGDAFWLDDMLDDAWVDTVTTFPINTLGLGVDIVDGEAIDAYLGY